jgi:hypothetical protein
MLADPQKRKNGDCWNQALEDRQKASGQDGCDFVENCIEAFFDALN